MEDDDENHPTTSRPEEVPNPVVFNWAPEAWPLWSRRFQRFLTLSGLDKEDGKRQVDYLIYLMGDRAESVLATFTYGRDESKSDVVTVISKFDRYFGHSVNPIYQRARFNQRTQRPGEPVQEFITDLFALASNCNYGTLKDELIRDRIIVGISDNRLSAALQMDPELTLEKAREQAVQAELVQKHLQDRTSVQGEAIKKHKPKGRDTYQSDNNNHGHGQSQQSSQTGQSNNSYSKSKHSSSQSRSGEKACGRCGRTPSHPLPACPAAKGNCNRCSLSGDWSTACRTFVSAATNEVAVQADASGEDVETVEVPAANSSSLVRSVAASQGTKAEDEFAGVFTGLGCMKEEYVIRMMSPPPILNRIEPNKTVCLVPEEFFEVIQRAVKDLIAMDVIERVTEPSLEPLKQRVKYHNLKRMFIDFTPLNNKIEMDCQEIPTVEECLADIGSEATVFSCLEARSGYWQVPLAEECRGLTAFETPFGRFRWKRMPMGLITSRDVFVDRKRKALKGLRGVCIHMSDCVWGKDVEEHDSRLREVLQRYKQAGLTLNKEQCQIRVSECVFLGHKISAGGIKPANEKKRAILQMKRPVCDFQMDEFLSFFNYNHIFMENLTLIYKSLYGSRDHLGPNTANNRITDIEKVFTQAKDILITAPSRNQYPL